MDFITRLNRIQSLFTVQLTQATIWEFILNLVIGALLAFWITRFYVKYGKAISNRRAFSANFIPLVMTVTLIITVVRSSLALSLGLIGALSIVRFRAAIKEPEELSYLFFVIAVGLGLGAQQRLITIIAVITILGILWLKNIYRRDRHQEQSLYLTVTTHHPQQLKLEQATEILEKNCSLYKIKRVDQTDSIMEVSFLVEFREKDSLHSIESALRRLDEAVKVTFLDYKGGIL